MVVGRSDRWPYFTDRERGALLLAGVDITARHGMRTTLSDFIRAATRIQLRKIAQHDDAELLAELKEPSIPPA